MVRIFEVWGMYFKISMRRNPSSGEYEGYYRLVESYRNENNRVCHRTMLHVGFWDEVEPDKLNLIQRYLTDRASGKMSCFEEADKTVLTLTEKLWARLISEKKIDLPEASRQKRERLVDIETLKHKDVREVGAEWLAYQAVDQLKIGSFLKGAGWHEEQVQLAITQIVSRAVYPASELKTSRWVRENSAICELTGYPLKRLTKDKLYSGAHSLYRIKEALENHLSKRTNELFDLQDKIILYDLTNTYFEGEMRNSRLARYGRSKEKRSDCKLVVLALVINSEGFIKFSSVYEGNTSDSQTLPDIIERLRLNTSENTRKATVVLDAGIATEDNLALLEAKGYDYVCVSRQGLKDYEVVSGHDPVMMTTKSKQKLTLQRVSSAKTTDYYLKVNSLGKRLKETSMKTQFESRFELELEKLHQGLSRKHTTKRADKVQQRLGRAIQKYPSVSKYYDIEVTENQKGQATSIQWSKNPNKYRKVVQNLGIYFLRTNIQLSKEEELWNIYNTIREVESSFRTLKTDLDLRPIYHKKDDATMAHLHLGLLAYWLVNTIRYQLKSENIRDSWTEIVRKANTQKVITTSGTNIEGTIISIRRCSEPNKSLKDIYQALKYKDRPFTKRKSVVHKPKLKKQNNAENQNFTPP